MAAALPYIARAVAPVLLGKLAKALGIAGRRPKAITLVAGTASKTRSRKYTTKRGDADFHRQHKDIKQKKKPFAKKKKKKAPPKRRR